MERYKLRELIDVTRGASLPGDNYATEGELIRLTLGNFDYKSNGFKENTSKDDIYYNGEVDEAYILEKGDIITPLTEQAIGLLGSTAKVPESGKYIQSQDVALVKVISDKLVHDFAYFLLPTASVKKQLSAAAQQTSIRHTSPDKIKDCTVFLPDPKDQQKIADFLNQIEDKIALNRKENATLEAMAKQLYDYWFVQFDFPDANGKPYKSSGGKMVYNETLKREIPEGWEDCTLQDMCEMYQPQNLPTDLLSNDKEFRVYGANGRIGYFDTYNHDDSEIAMSCRGNSCGVINRTMPKSFITSNAMVITMKDKSIHNEFIAQSIRYMNISGAITGSGQPQITRENLQIVKLLKPDQSVLANFSRYITLIVDMIIHNDEETDVLSKQMNNLLPLIMSGQATVN